MGTKRPISMARPTVVLYQPVLAARPAKAEPLLLVTEAKAYVISLKPWNPGLRIELVPAGITREMLPSTRVTIGIVST